MNANWRDVAKILNVVVAIIAIVGCIVGGWWAIEASFKRKLDRAVAGLRTEIGVLRSEIVENRDLIIEYILKE